MILAYNELVDMVERGVIQNIKNPEKQIQGASIDVTLGSKLLLEKRYTDTIKLSDPPQPYYEPVTEKNPLPTIELNMTDKYLLEPQEFVLAETNEIFNLPDDICAIYYMNSSMARNGLQHMLATFCDPTWNGSKLTLELQNVLGFHSIELRHGMRIGQVVFYRISSSVPLEKSYAIKGRYNNDLSVKGAKVR